MHIGGYHDTAFALGRIRVYIQVAVCNFNNNEVHNKTQIVPAHLRPTLEHKVIIDEQSH
jgi:hypothetical protein